MSLPGHVFHRKPASSNYATVLDIGANTGLCAAWFFSRFPNAHYYCVEPDPGNFKLMEANLNGLIPQDRLHCLRVAVGERDGRGEMAFSRYAYNNRVIVHEEGKISMLSIPSILEHFRLSHIDILKIDIEGAEEAVLQDAAWLGKVRCLFIEFHSDTGLKDGVAKLEEAGFRWKTCPGNDKLIFAGKTIF